jgi:hypothetical protein
MGSDYIFVTDLNALPCVPAKKDQVIARYGDLDPSRIAVVITEIEGWYIAGANERSRLARRFPSRTDGLTKEQFNDRIPRTFESRIDYMLELLKQFSVPTAKRRNSSFRYFAERYLP